MRLVFLRCLAFTSAVSVLCGCSESENAEVSAPEQTSLKEHRAILYYDGEGRLQMDYEGTGYRQSSTQRGEDVEFRAMHLNHWTEKDIQNEKHVDAQFAGTIASSGEGGRHVRIDLEVKTKVNFEIHLMGMQPRDEELVGEIVEKTFSPGEHVLRFEGVIKNQYGRK